MKLKNLLKSVFFIISICMFLVSCEWKTVVKPEVVVPEEVSFATDIEPIFESAGCTGCHNSPGASANLDLRTGYAYNSITSGGFVNITTPEESLIYQVHLENGPTSVKYSDQEAALVLKWIQDGALNN
jgi:hypothetical protein